MPPRQPRKMVGRSAESRGPSEARNRSALSSSRSDSQTCAQIRRADLLAGLDDEFGIEAELAAARLAHRTQRRQIDAVLALVIGGAAAIDAIAFRRRPPRIEIVAPFADHAVDDVAVAVGEHGRQRSVLAIVRQQIRALAGRGFDQSGREIELRKCRLQFLHEIGAQRIAASADSGFPS